MASIAQKLSLCRDLVGAPLTLRENNILQRAVEVLRRISENDCTNARQEAADMMRELDARN